jgi:hypothetical protein
VEANFDEDARMAPRRQFETDDSRCQNKSELQVVERLRRTPTPLPRLGVDGKVKSLVVIPAAGECEELGFKSANRGARFGSRARAASNFAEAPPSARSRRGVIEAANSAEAASDSQ